MIEPTEINRRRISTLLRRDDLHPREMQAVANCRVRQNESTRSSSARTPRRSSAPTRGTTPTRARPPPCPRPLHARPSCWPRPSAASTTPPATATSYARAWGLNLTRAASRPKVICCLHERFSDNCDAASARLLMNPLQHLAWKCSFSTYGRFGILRAMGKVPPRMICPGPRRRSRPRIAPAH